MKYYLLSVAVCLVVLTGNAQHLQEKAQRIAKEADWLYKCEKARALSNAYNRLVSVDSLDIGSFITYPFGDWQRTFFYSKGASPFALATVDLDSTLLLERCIYDPSHRPLTTYEKELIRLRDTTIKWMARSNFYIDSGTIYTVVAAMEGNKGQVYIRYSSLDTIQVLFGRDYVSPVGNDGWPGKFQSLHEDLSFLAQPEPGRDTVLKTVKFHFHSGAESPFMTATDLCTFRLYAEMNGWKEFVVHSPTYTTIYKVENDLLRIYTPDELKTMPMEYKYTHDENRYH